MPTYTNDTLVAVKAIRTALLADATFSAGVGGRVYYKMIPNSFEYPFAFIDLNAGAEDNESAANMSDLRYLVKVVGNYKTSYEALAILAGRIYGLLHEIDLSDVSEGWFIWRSQRITIVDYVEITTEVTYSHIGGVYRLRLSS